ncbi:MAG: hypothetical protein ACFE8P_17380, partial [Promethearchaeota archaeon]
MDDNVGPIEEPKSSILGNDTWWNTNWKYRRIIEITNPYPLNFTNYGTSVVFNYAELEGTFRPNLQDIRIIENDIPRRYYFLKDYPSPNYVTIWFDTNISQGEPERDTYLYYGNSGASDARASDPSKSFGWVKNGDFELDISEDPKFIPFGWNFTDDPVDEHYNPSTLQPQPISGVAGTTCSYNEPHNYTVNSYNNFEYRIISGPINQERVGHGTYAYKFGSPASTVLNGDGTSHEYVGTLYSYPFTVPIIEGGEISLIFYRNIRTHIFEDKPGAEDIVQDGYFMRLANGSAAEYTSDVDNQANIGTDYNNYIELYGGDAHLAGQKYTEANDLQVHYAGEVKDTGTPAELTGNMTFDVTDYMGKEIFIELGTWGEEDGYPRLGWSRSGFFQLDNVIFNYTLRASLDELQTQVSVVTVIAKDVDGRVVPNAKIFIFDGSDEIKSGVATKGRIKFTNVPRGRYNITANYTLGSQEVEVFNSFTFGIKPYYFN